MNYIIKKFSHIIKFTFILFFLICLPSNSEGASATFLKIPVGARPAALGGAFSAFKGDVNSIAYNPGALSYINETGISLMRANYIGGIKHDWLSLARPHRNGAVSAIAINSLSINSIDGYANDGTPADSVSSADLAFNFAHARKLSDKIGFGLNLKYITERLDTERANAFAADLGVLIESPIENLDFAFVAENLGSKMKFIEDAFYLPARAKAGFLYKRNILNLKCAYSAEMIIPADGKKSFLTGLETIFNNQFFLRAGWQNSRDLGSEITYGLGYMLKVSQKMNMNIDYAFADYGEFGNVHRFGITLKFAGTNN
ncbi:MAG: PorV/PorQ family protein [Elusimicrobiales bacterium]|nr:PorV/PorQ family protein [Elusimicrobiales bacterium]